MNLNITNDIIESLYNTNMNKINENKYRNIIKLFKFKERAPGKKRWFFESYWIKSYNDRYYNMTYYGNDSFRLHLNFKQEHYGRMEEYIKYNKHCSNYEINQNFLGDVYSVTWFTEIDKLDKLLEMLFPKDLRSEKIKNIINEK